MKFEFFIHDRRVRPWGQALVASRSWCCDERCTTDVADLPRFELGNMSMAIAGRAPSGDSASRGVRSGTGGLGALAALAPKLLTLAALSLAMALAGCAQHSAQHEVKADPIEAAAPPHGYPDVRIRRPNRALLVSQPAPDCEFRSTELKTVDPDQWGRLRLDYERQCYRRRRRFATVCGCCRHPDARLSPFGPRRRPSGNRFRRDRPSPSTAGPDGHSTFRRCGAVIPISHGSRPTRSDLYLP